ncbi:uncharacterized protein C11orf96-like [Schistocerca piceifrons]|uniref:uncharacterized protein C11orf96-like n=1 Tax=Schistocerca piceifrons TaxID=274613 RepID=UPI001F5F8AFD|nr:uncharacterized protein C11orf96-like [Schistocerca piceifrons]
MCERAPCVALAPVASHLRGAADAQRAWPGATVARPAAAIKARASLCVSGARVRRGRRPGTSFGERRRRRGHPPSRGGRGAGGGDPRARREWSPGGGGGTAGAAGQHQQQLSVVTTVWGVTTSTQSGPAQQQGGVGVGVMGGYGQGKPPPAFAASGYPRQQPPAQQRPAAAPASHPHHVLWVPSPSPPHLAATVLSDGASRPPPLPLLRGRKRPALRLGRQLP